MFSSSALNMIDLARLFDNSPNPYVILDRSLRVVGVNKAYLAATMRSRETLIGRDIFELFPTDPTSEQQKNLRASFAKVFAEQVTDQLPIISYPIPRSDGSLEDRYWQLTHTPIFDDDGNVRFVLQHATDVTDLRQAELAAHDSEARFRQLAQSMPNHIWTATPDGRLDWCNDRIYEYSGSPVGAFDDDDWVNFLHPDDHVRAGQVWAAAMRDCSLYQAEYRLRRRDGVYRWFIVRAAPLKDANGVVVRWIGNNTEIEDQKKIEAELAVLNETLEQRVDERTAELVRVQEALRQSQKMEAIGNLAGGIAHDFNNLLQVIAGNLHLLERESKGNPRAERLVRNALGGVSRGAQLASQLLSFGRKQPLRPRVLNLGRLMQDIDHLIRRSVGDSIEVKTIIAPDLWNTVVDPANFENACLNLVINARDAMAADGGRLTIEIANATLDDIYLGGEIEAKGGEYVMLAVSDTGHGMSPQVLSQVFDPFFTTKPEGKGTGLGLSMVYGLVKQLDGHIQIDSAPGKGTTVHIYLPRSLQAEASLAPVHEAKVDGGSETVLIAEDDASVRATTTGLLADLGYKVLAAQDAAGALAIIESGAEIDLLLSDIVMPGKLKGVELAKIVRERHPNIAVLFCSGYADDAAVVGGRQADGFDLLAKPYSMQDLARHVRKALAQRPNAADPEAQKRPIVLLCEDEAIISMNTASIIEDMGLSVIETASGEEALGALAEGVDLLIADIGLPDMSGIDLAQKTRALYPDLPIVFATGQTTVPEASRMARVNLLLKPYGEADLRRVVRWACPQD